jgi:hypothetical protein
VPESVILISPHAPLEVDAFVTHAGPEVFGDFSHFEAPDTFFTVEVDRALPYRHQRSCGRTRL